MKYAFAGVAVIVAAGAAACVFDARFEDGGAAPLADAGERGATDTESSSTAEPGVTGDSSDAGAFDDTGSSLDSGETASGGDAGSAVETAAGGDAAPTVDSLTGGDTGGSDVVAAPVPDAGLDSLPKPDALPDTPRADAPPDGPPDELPGDGSAEVPVWPP
ncbi:MAG: hypothetical protein HYV09_31875 [Deltaproteobacteria bacterium]|nr:hypothetical protein [Deltaproteobacteria bacterium]